LFAAGFYGRNDGAWIANAGLRATCVDHDVEKMSEMQKHYPPSWNFIIDDAFAFSMKPGKYDLVSVDPPSGLSTVCFDQRDLWLNLARRVLVLGAQQETIIGKDTHNAEVIPRNSTSLWLVWKL
jgi:hypothetical protein